MYRNTNELYHYGVIGMKWGVRRYQDAQTGKYTEAGRRRYIKDRTKNISGSKYEKLAAEEKAGKKYDKLVKRETSTYGRDIAYLTNRLKKDAGNDQAKLAQIRKQEGILGAKAIGLGASAALVSNAITSRRISVGKQLVGLAALQAVGMGAAIAVNRQYKNKLQKQVDKIDSRR